MAAYGVDTEEGVSSTQTVNSDSEIAKWLKAQNLQKLIPLFAQEDMTLDELIEFADDEVNFKQYLKELNVPKASVFRILSKIKKTKQSKSPSASNDAVSNPNAVVVITQKEQDAMDSLSKRNENINALMQRLAEQDEKVSQNEQSVQSTINEEYTHLIDLIQKSQDTALKTLRGIAKQKKSEISTRLQQLETQQNNTKNAMKSCNGFVYNVNMERTQRQMQILSTVDGVMKQDIPQNIGDVSSEIVFTFHKDGISSFVSNLVTVYAEAPHHVIPVMDEIKYEQDFEEKAFVYEHDYDTNGILYFLGTNYGIGQWRNPAERGLIAISLLDDTDFIVGSINDMVGRTCTQTYTNENEHNWVAIDFGAKLKIKPTGYTLQYGNTRGGCEWYLRNWNFEGSNDGSNWSIIKQHKKDTTFTELKQSHTWIWSDCNTYYRHFRIKMTGKNAFGDWIIAYAALEIYGYLNGQDIQIQD
eukprot:603837_1